MNSHHYADDLDQIVDEILEKEDRYPTSAEQKFVSLIDGMWKNILKLRRSNRSYRLDIGNLHKRVQRGDDRYNNLFNLHRKYQEENRQLKLELQRLGKGDVKTDNTKSKSESVRPLSWLYEASSSAVR